MAGSLPVVNLSKATFECTFGRGCPGICCQNGRPGVWPEEIERIDSILDQSLPELRPEARSLIEQDGYLSNRRKQGLPMLRVVNGWCVFFNQGCVLHKIGAIEGDTYRYKPSSCALFPLARDERDRWYVRQKGYKGEDWKLFCLDPKNSSVLASASLASEIAFAKQITEEQELQNRLIPLEVRAS